MGKKSTSECAVHRTLSLQIGKTLLPTEITFSPHSDVSCEHYMKLLTSMCMIACILLLPHDWVIVYLHEFAHVQVSPLNWLVSVFAVMPLFQQDIMSFAWTVISN